MNEYFNFQENESHNLRSGIHLASRNMHTAHCGSDTVSSLGPKQWRLKNMPQHYQLSKPNIC